MRTLCVALILGGSVILGISTETARNPRSTSNDHWAHIISDYIRGVSGNYQSTHVRDSNEKLKTGSHNRLPFPILIVPVPVDLHSKESCTDRECSERYTKKKDDLRIDVRTSSIAEQVNDDFYAPLRAQVSKQQGTRPQDTSPYGSSPQDFRPQFQGTSPQVSRPQDFRVQVRNQQHTSLYDSNPQDFKPQFQYPRPQVPQDFRTQTSKPQSSRPYDSSPQVKQKHDDEDYDHEDEADVAFAKDKKVNQYRTEYNRLGNIYVPEKRKPAAPAAPATSEELLQQFHNQYQYLQDQELPPALIDRDAFEPTTDTEQDYPDEEHPSVSVDQRKGGPSGNHHRVSSGFRVEPAPQTPPTPQWDFSVAVRGELHVPRADYTEPYQMWYNAETGASRVDFHEGGARTYRMVNHDGRVQRIAMRIDRLGESNIVECRVGPPEVMSKEDLQVPGLPDMSEYNFNGYDTSSNVHYERWSRTVRTDDGNHGRNGEVLTYNHEMLVNRQNGKSMPVAYTVKVDSSILGSNCDAYTHRYHEVTEMNQHDDPALFDFNIENNCNKQEHVDPSNLEHLAHLEPLREFTMPSRDQRYDIQIEKFKEQFDRKYADSTEESVRKNIFMQCSRFVFSGNRQSATFELEINFLGDRLLAEIQQLLGVNVEEGFLDSAGYGGDVEQFPHPEPVVRKLSRKLPKKFDWRPRGAVTDVKWQGSCQSCWAFAVTGAVEGALYVRRKVLIPLSEQCLVDCGHPFGTHGCGGTWPRFAYNYVKARGLPATEEYGPYTEKEEVCRERRTTPVTRISAYVNVTQRSVPALQIAIRRHAPSVVIIDATAKSFIFYKRGVLYDDRCGKTLPQLNHAVLAVGWGEQRRKTHFILKNSWSAAWGEGGYIRVQGPANTCGVLEQPSYPRLEDSDVVTTRSGRN